MRKSESITRHMHVSLPSIRAVREAVSDFSRPLENAAASTRTFPHTHTNTRKAGWYYKLMSRFCCVQSGAHPMAGNVTRGRCVRARAPPEGNLPPVRACGQMIHARACVHRDRASWHAAGAAERQRTFTTPTSKPQNERWPKTTHKHDVAHARTHENPCPSATSHPYMFGICCDACARDK